MTIRRPTTSPVLAAIGDITDVLMTGLLGALICAVVLAGPHSRAVGVLTAATTVSLIVSVAASVARSYLRNRAMRSQPTEQP